MKIERRNIIDFLTQGNYFAVNSKTKCLYIHSLDGLCCSFTSKLPNYLDY